jgi:Flp pilus assembly protein protease CpaA
MDGAQLVEIVRWASTLALGAAAVALELRTRRIPNGLTLGALLPTFAAAWALGRFGDAVTGFLVAGAFGIWVFNTRVLAGGGVKTAAMLGAAAGAAGGVALACAMVVLAATSAVMERRGKEMGQWPSTPTALGVTLVGLAARALWVRFG